jgi:type I restriction enzyme R subunit
MGAERLGLSGKVRAEDFLRLCENQHPATGERLTPELKTTRIQNGKNVADRRIFYDFTFSPPKSVSLAGFLGNDERILKAHDRAARVALKHFEDFAATRVRIFEWKRIEREDEPRQVSLEVMIRGTCDPARLLDLVENFTLFSEHKAGLVKIIGQNHQFLGVNNAIASMVAARKLGHGRGGVFWQTQGSGKSFSMVFFAQKVLRKVAGNWTFVVVTDRVELDDQIAKTFKATGAVSESEGDQCHAASGAHLRELLRGNHRYVFTLIHKCRPESCSNGRESALTPPAGVKEVSRLTSAATSGEVMPVLCDRPDVIVLTDEAHRSQYDTLALNMRAALPKAIFIAFTRTPLIAGEERTKEVFGD